MTECEECGKKLGIFEGYQHPTMGKKNFLCSSCFEQVSESISRWGRFVMANSFNNQPTKMNLSTKWKNIVPTFASRRNMIKDVSAETNTLFKHK